MPIETARIYKAVHSDHENTVVFYERADDAPHGPTLMHFWVHQCMNGTVVVCSNNEKFRFAFDPDTGLNPIAAVIIASIAVAQALAAQGSEPDDSEIKIVKA